jgi:hypothetical protein
MRSPIESPECWTQHLGRGTHEYNCTRQLKTQNSAEASGIVTFRKLVYVMQSEFAEPGTKGCAASEKATPRIPEVAFLDKPIADTRFAGF